MTLLDQIRQTLSRYAMLCTGDHLGVAVSGGADSLCLLHALLQLRAEYHLTLSVIHVDHNLRGPESQADAQFVHKTAQQLGLPFHLRTLDLTPLRGNLEQEARRARHQVFRDLIREGVVQKVALGHTRSDQAETVLFRLLRGAGSAGLAGIRPVTEGGLIRPLLQVTRLQVEDWLQERNIAWRDDSSNSDVRFDRNRLRHRLIPQLETEWNPALSETLARTADWAFEEERYWQQEIPRLTANWVRFVKGAALVDAGRLSALPVAVARRVIREIVRQTKGDLLGVAFDHFEAIRHLAALSEGSGNLQLPGVEVCRSFNWLRFAIPAAPDPDWEFPVPSGKTDDKFCLSVSGMTIRFQLLPNNGVYNRDVNALDWERTRVRARGTVVLRNWRPGDEYQRHGHAGPEKMKELFQQFRIPSWERRNWPVLTIGSSIAWASRFGPAAQFAVDADSRTVLSIHELRETSDSDKA